MQRLMFVFEITTSHQEYEPLKLIFLFFRLALRSITTWIQFNDISLAHIRMQFSLP